MDEIIVVKELNKVYGKVKVLENFSLSVPKGSTYAILGPNGSGKTTFFRCLLGLEFYQSGSILINGKQNTEVERKNFAVSFDDAGFNPQSSGLNNLRIDALLKDLDSNSYLRPASILEIDYALKKKVKNYSTGMKKRLSLCSAFIKELPVVLMDEPTNGLDVIGIRAVRSLIQERKDKGLTTLISSHILSEIEQVATHYLFLKKGKIYFNGTSGELFAEGGTLEEQYLKILN